MSTNKGGLKAQPSDAPAKRKRSPCRSKRVTIVKAAKTSAAHSTQVLSLLQKVKSIQRQAWWDGYLAALKAIEPSRWETVRIVAAYVVAAAWLAGMGSHMTYSYLADSRQLVSLRTCRPVVLEDLNRQRRRLEEQIESLQPRGYASLEAR